MIDDQELQGGVGVQEEVEYFLIPPSRVQALQVSDIVDLEARRWIVLSREKRKVHKSIFFGGILPSFTKESGFSRMTLDREAVKLTCLSGCLS